MAITAEVRNELIELVVGMFNAAPGFTIMTDLATASNAGSSVAEIAASLEASTEFKNLYPVFLTNEEFATKLVNSMVGSLVSAEQKEIGVDLLVAELNAGSSRSGAILSAVTYLSAVPADEENWGAAATAFNNKVEVATYFTIDQQASAGSLKELQDVIAAVTDDATSVAAAKGSIDGTAVAGQTLMLTTGVDTILGGTGNDTINATVAGTLNAGDSIDGGAGTDRLNIKMTAGSNNNLTGVTVKNVEAVYIDGANFQTTGNAAVAALTTATAAKAVTAASLAAAQASGVTAQQQDNAANAVTVLATSVAAGAGAGKEGEDAVLSAATATVASAASNAAAATAVAALATEADVLTATTTTQTTLTAAGVTAYIAAQYNAAALAAFKSDAGAAITGGTLVVDRAALLASEAAAVVTFGSGNFTLAQLNAAATAALKSAIGATLITNADDSTAIATRAADLDAITDTVITAAAAETAKAVVADNTAASALAVATTAAAGATVVGITGSQFVGAGQVWLDGASSGKANLTVSAAQIAGLNKVTSLDNTIAFGATGVLALEGSSGKSTITGAAGGLTIAGSTGTLALTHAGTATTGVKALTLNMSGASSFDVSAMTALTSVVSTGAGNVTVNPKALGTSLASITTGAGNDTVRINTTTVKENVLTTPAVIAVNAVVNTGAGNDTVRVATTGDGKTTVETGAGGDTIYVQTVSSGVSKIDAGADNDTVFLNTTLGANPNLTIDGGAGTDAIVMGAGSGAAGLFTAVDYLRMNNALSNFEAVRFTAATTVDASKLDIGSIGAFAFWDGANVITEVAGQTLTLARYAGVTTATDFVPTAPTTSATGLNATAAGYKAGAASSATTVYGGALTVNASGNAAMALTLKGSSATVGVTATGGATASVIAPTVTLGAAASDLQSLSVNLTSATNTTTGAPVLATFDTGTITDTVGVGVGEHLESLSSLKVNGSGVFTVSNAGLLANAALVSLTTIDVSGMTAFFAKNAVGANVGDNVSATTITLNDFVAETVILGGAKDTVVTGSTVAAMDTITGFQLTANATTATLVDLTKSDRLNVADGTYLKFTTTATTLIGALTEAGAIAGAAGDFLVFHFGGDTYVYSDTNSNGLDDADGLVKLVGLYDLDLLIQGSATQAGVLI